MEHSWSALACCAVKTKAAVDHQEQDHSANPSWVLNFSCFAHLQLLQRQPQSKDLVRRWERKRFGTCRPGNFNLMFRFCLPRWQQPLENVWWTSDETCAGLDSAVLGYNSAELLHKDDPSECVLQLRCQMWTLAANLPFQSCSPPTSQVCSFSHLSN